MKENIDTEKIINKYSDIIYKIALGYLRNTTDAEDIVQEVLIKYISNKKPFKNEEHEKSWIIRVTLNMCFNEKHCARNRKSILIDNVDKIKWFKTENSYIIDLIDSLNNKYKSVFELFYIHDFSTKEISKIMKISEVAVRTRLKRARNSIKEKLKEGEN